MVLPQKAIEQLEREPVQTPGWARRALMFSSTIFFLSVATYFGIRFGYLPYLNARVEELNNEIQLFTKEVPLSDQEKLINFYSQLVNLRTTLDKQKNTSIIFPWIEQNTQKNVYFPTFGIELRGGTVSLSGRAKSIDDLTQQIASLQTLPELKTFEFTGGSVDSEGIWSFNLGLTFQEKFFEALQMTETSSL